MFLAAFLVSWPVVADSWPQYRGTRSDGVARERLELSSFSTGNPILWRVPLGEAFSGIVVTDDRVLTTTSDERHDLVVAFDAASGRELWRTAIDALFVEQFGNGPRATPLVDGDRVFATSGRGLLVALAAATGKILWQVDLKEKFGAPLPTFGFTASPLSWGSLLIVEVGAEDAALAAFDREGELKWLGGRGKTAYSSPIVAELLGREVVLLVNQQGLQALDQKGRTLLSYAWRPQWAIKPALPIVFGRDRVLLSASYDAGAVALELFAEAGVWRAEPLWQSQVLRNQFNPSVLLDGLVFGFDNATLKAIDPATGAAKWAERGQLGKGSLIAAPGLLIVLSETGKLILAKAQATKYQELAAVQVLEAPCWTAPTLAGGRLFLRDKKTLIALRVGGAALP